VRAALDERRAVSIAGDVKILSSGTFLGHVAQLPRVI
jgi:hypothetical protein